MECGERGVIAIDTNVLVRFLVQDDEVQYKRSLNLFQGNQIFVADSVVLETEWVLRFAYDYSPTEICTAFRRVFGLKNVMLAEPLLIAKAIVWHESGLDFADALHLAKCQHLKSLRTFDDKFVKRSKGLSECKVTVS